VQVLIDIAVSPKDAAALWTPEAVETFMERAVELTGLHAISDYFVIEHGGEIQGHVIIAESHIDVALHPAHGRGFVDVFSCRDFSEAKVQLALEETLLTPNGMINVERLPRGDLPQKEG
jgi:S-adenosylmethionine/arginine decarboxylase-like enzyme